MNAGPVKGEVCNFCATCATKQNCENKDFFQIGFQNTLPF